RDESGDHTFAQRLDLALRGVPTDDLDLSCFAGLAHRLGGTEHARLVARVYAVEIRIGGQDVLGDLQRFVEVAVTGLLRHQLQPGVLRHSLPEPLGTGLVRAGARLEFDDR